MKKFLLILSIVCFGVAIIGSWFYSALAGLIVTLVVGLLIAADVYLINNNPRLWASIAMFVLSLLLLFWIGTKVGFGLIGGDSISNTEITNVYDEEESETEVITDEEEIEEEPEEVLDEKEEVVKEEQTTIVKEVIKEVPVEKVVVKEVVKEVPKVEYVEIEKKPETPTPTPVPTPTPIPTPTPTPIPNYNNMNYGGPTTVYGYGYQNGYGYNGNYNTTSIKIKGPTEVYAGETETYTISGINSFSKSKLKLPENVSYADHYGNKVELYFDEDITSGYCMIEYGTAKLKVDIIPD